MMKHNHDLERRVTADRRQRAIWAIREAMHERRMAERRREKKQHLENRKIDLWLLRYNNLRADAGLPPIDRT